MSARRARLRDPQTCPKSGPPPARQVRAAERDTARPRRLRYLREHAMALALAGLLALVAVPPALVGPSGEGEVIATGALTVLACVLIAYICYVTLRR